METVAPNENPAIALLTEQCKRYADTQKRLEAQLNGVQSKLAETKAKHDATKEALEALIAQFSQTAKKGGSS